MARLKDEYFVARLDGGYDMENECCNKIRKEIIMLFQNHIRLISNDDGLSFKVFKPACNDYPHLNPNNPGNWEKTLEELGKMEKDGLILLKEDFIGITDKGKEVIFG